MRPRRQTWRWRPKPQTQESATSPYTCPLCSPPPGTGNDPGLPLAVKPSRNLIVHCPHGLSPWRMALVSPLSPPENAPWRIALETPHAPLRSVEWFTLSMSFAMQYFLAKTDPETYSIDNLEKEK